MWYTTAGTGCPCTLSCTPFFRFVAMTRKFWSSKITLYTSGSPWYVGGALCANARVTPTLVRAIAALMRILIQASLHFTEAASQLLASDTYFACLQTSWSFFARRHRRVDELQFIGGHRRDEAFLIRTFNEVRVGTSFNLGANHLVGFADRVSAKISDGSLHHGLVSLGGPLIPIFGGELGKASPHIHQNNDCW